MGEQEQCRYCDNTRSGESDGHEYPPYAYDEWVCDDCWDNCPNCDHDAEWDFKNTKATKHSTKVCKSCGFEFTTQPATG